MKIAINIEHFTEAKGGAERYAVGLANALAGKGHDVHILACFSYKNCENDFQCHQIPYATFRTFRDIKFARASQKELSKEKFDVCLSLSRSMSPELYNPHGGVHLAYLKRELKSIPNSFMRYIKFLFWTISLRQFLIKRIERNIFKQRDLIVVAVSKMIKRDILSFYDFPEDQIKVIFNAVDLERFDLTHHKAYRREIESQHSINDEDLLILFVADNFRLKGLRNLIRAAALMKKSMKPGTGFRVIVLGDGKKSTYERLALKLGCRDKFIFNGKTSEIEKFYLAADVLAQPTFYDPCSLSTLEGMAAGLPIITTSCNGAAELIKDGIHGFVLHDPENYAELSQKLLLFLDKNLRDEMGLNARKAVESYSLQENIEKMLLLCEGIARKKGKG